MFLLSRKLRHYKDDVMKDDTQKVNSLTCHRYHDSASDVRPDHGVCVFTSDALFRRSPVTERLKSQKTDCSNPHQDLGLTEITVPMVSCPIVLMVLQTSLVLFSHQIQASGQRKRQRC